MQNNLIELTDNEIERLTNLIRSESNGNLER